MKELTALDLAWTDEDSVSTARDIRNQPGAIVLPSRLSAGVVVRIASEIPGAMIVVSDDKIHGLIDPDLLIQEFENQHNVSTKSLADLVHQLDAKDGEESLRHILAMRPRLFWCKAGGHRTTKAVCHDEPTDPLM